MAKQRPKGQQFLKVFFDVNMACQHPGLTGIARRHGIKVNNLERGQWLVFFNGGLNKVKFLGAGGVLGYYRVGRRHLTMSDLSALHEAFGYLGGIHIPPMILNRLGRMLAQEKQRRTA